MARTPAPPGMIPYSQAIREGRIYLREWREAAGLSQEELALRLGVRHSAISRWESGKREITLTRLGKIAAEITPDGLLSTLFRDPAQPIAEHPTTAVDALEIIQLWRQLTPGKRLLAIDLLKGLRDL
jgi:transcriptional regulator with XRE-family HTH domain